MTTITWDQTFFHDPHYRNEVHEVFTTARNGMGPKDQAKACVVGDGPLPRYFFHASSYASGAKFYMVDQLHPWWLRYQQKKVREEYEVLTDVFPLKLFFDLEFVPTCNPHVSMDKCIAILHEGIRACLKRSFAFHEIVRLDANIPTKTSTHLIYPTVVFHSMAHMYHFIWNILLPSLPMGTLEVFKGSGDERDHVIDTSVYSKDRLFRLYGSTKGKKRNPLLPPGALRSDPLCFQRMTDSLVSFPQHFDNMIAYNLRIERPYVTHNNPTLSNLICQKAVQLHSPDIPNIRAVACGTRGTVVNIHLIPGIKCGIVWRVHKHNTTYFTVDTRTGHGWYQCTDPECRATRSKGKFNVGTFTQFRV